jgi:SAM-dependent methyltransferase
VGLDNAAGTIEGVRRLFPELPIVCGDVCHLPYEDRSFAAYLSLGVVEHLCEGPDRALREAHRVLADDGVLIISVPQVFPWRLREVGLRSQTEGFFFYQYAFPPSEFAAILAKNGFSVKEQYGYGSEFGLKLRWPAQRRLFASFPRAAVAVRLALDATPLYALLAQMRLYVARKE